MKHSAFIQYERSTPHCIDILQKRDILRLKFHILSNTQIILIVKIKLITFGM